MQVVRPDLLVFPAQVLFQDLAAIASSGAIRSGITPARTALRATERSPSVSAREPESGKALP
ncbi:hypothetical protein GCM10010524_47320 [Streptomyces mexicanus]